MLEDSDDETIKMNATASKYYNNIETILIALKLISRIRPGDRLSTRSNKMQIMRSGPFQPVRRLMGWEGRHENMLEIRELIDNIKKLESVPPSIVNNITNVISGLRSLQVTYQTDATTCAELDVIIEQLSQIQDKLAE